MKTSELVKLVRKAGNIKIRDGSGHEIWQNPKTGRIFTIPRHNAEVPTGTANSILKCAGLK